MKKQLAVISVLLTCAVCHAQNTLWGEVSFLEKADYFWSVSRFSDDHEIVGAAIDSASVYYSKAIESGTVREDLLPSVYLRLGYCHAMHGRFTESVRWNLLRLKNISEKYGEDSPEYAYSLLSIANVYSLAGDADRAEALMEAALSVYGKSGAGPFNGADTIARIDFLKTRINIKCERQKVRSAIRDAKEAVRLVGDYYGKSSQQYADEVLVLSALYGAMDYDPLAIKWASEAYDSYAVGVMKRFSTMSDDARRRYWNYASGYFHRIAKEGSPEIAYNSVLFSKGILLNTARAYTEFLYANADSTIMEDYHVGKSTVTYPESIKNNVHAQAFYGVLSAVFNEAKEAEVSPDFAAKIAEEITKIVANHSQVDWTNNKTIHDRISQDIDDLFYDYEKEQGLKLSFDTIDKIIENVKTVALRRF